MNFISAPEMAKLIFISLFQQKELTEELLKKIFGLIRKEISSDLQVFQFHNTETIVRAPWILQLNRSSLLKIEDLAKYNIDVARFWEDEFLLGDFKYFINSQWYRNTLDKEVSSFNVRELILSIKKFFPFSNFEVDVLLDKEVRNITHNNHVYLNYVTEKNQQPVFLENSHKTVDLKFKNNTTHPFLILAGISGTGKSRFVREQARRSCGLPYDQAPSNPENFCLIPVRPDWHEPSDLLGYISHISQPPKYISTAFFDFIVSAWVKVWEKSQSLNPNPSQIQDVAPYWLCLDEMNLAPVEQYFADYLSILETREWKSDQYFCQPLIKKDLLQKLDPNVLNELFSKSNLSNSIISQSSFFEWLKNQKLTPNTVNAYMNALKHTLRHISNRLNCSIEEFWELPVEQIINEISQYTSVGRKSASPEIQSWIQEQCDRRQNGDVCSVAQKIIDFRDQAQSNSTNQLLDAFLEHGIPLPPNLIVAGTVNMDETTHGFSRKVLDRALSLDFNEFYPNKFDQFFEDEKVQQPKTLTFSTTTQVTRGDLSATVDTDGSLTRDFVQAINEILKGTPFELAYRALNQALMLVAMWGQKNADEHDDVFEARKELTLAAIWDDFLMMKVLPRIEGDTEKLKTSNGLDLLSELQDQLSKSLKTIWHKDWDGKTAQNPSRPDLLQEDVKSTTENSIAAPKIPCRSQKKIAWMIKRLERGYTSFWA